MCRMFYYLMVIFGIIFGIIRSQDISDVTLASPMLTFWHLEIQKQASLETRAALASFVSHFWHLGFFFGILAS